LNRKKNSYLFGYQFKSIAGAAPIIGPIIAIQWG
jgi:carbon starvation protein CstA